MTELIKIGKNSKFSHFDEVINFKESYSANLYTLKFGTTRSLEDRWKNQEKPKDLNTDLRYYCVEIRC